MSKKLQGDFDSKCIVSRQSMEGARNGLYTPNLNLVNKNSLSFEIDLTLSNPSQWFQLDETRTS